MRDKKLETKLRLLSLQLAVGIAELLVFFFAQGKQALSLIFPSLRTFAKLLFL